MYRKQSGYVAVGGVAALFLALALLSGQAAAGRASTRLYIVGTDPLCTILPEVPPEVACPAISVADNGDTIWISGSGTFNPMTRAADGGGMFMHKNAAGDVVGEGTWMAVGLLSFHTYGTSEFPGVGTLEGGLVLLRVRLVGGGGTVEFDGVLQIDCLVGKPPRGAIEGVRLVVQGIDLNFNKEIQGLTVYIPM